jgi:hypothetical protein
MTCYTADFSGTLQATSEIAEIAFLAFADKAKSSTVDHLIFDDLLAKGLLA